MKQDKYFWKYEYEPGRKVKNNKFELLLDEPLISIITSYYNSNEFMWQTINCVLNQTFQSWEWIIVDDGSTDEQAIRYLKEVEKLDARIKIYHKENEGLALGRDYAIKYAKTEYILPLDADDLIEPTYIETLYWTMETNKDASWAFTNSVGFGKYIYLSDVKFDSEKMKINNHITATSLIRKDKILDIGGYGKAKRYMNEDWYLWLRMLSENQFPVQVGYYGFWYRRRPGSLLTEVNDTKKTEYELKMKDIKEIAIQIKRKVSAKIYPKEDLEKKLKEDNQFNIKNFQKIEILNAKKNSYLYILPYIGTDGKMYKRIKKEAKNKDIYIVTLQKNKFSQYVYRQKYEQFSTIYDLTTFLDEKYWISFIRYITKTRNIEKIFLSNTIYNQQIKEELEVIEIKNIKNNSIIYYFKIIKYKFMNCLPIRAVRKIKKICLNFIARKD